MTSPEAAMRTGGREGARWPWLSSRPDRALRCPHGRIQGSLVQVPEARKFKGHMFVGRASRPLFAH